VAREGPATLIAGLQALRALYRAWRLRTTLPAKLTARLGGQGLCGKSLLRQELRRPKSCPPSYCTLVGPGAPLPRQGLADGGLIALRARLPPLNLSRARPVQRVQRNENHRSLPFQTLAVGPLLSNRAGRLPDRSRSPIGTARVRSAWHKNPITRSRKNEHTKQEKAPAADSPEFVQAFSSFPGCVFRVFVLSRFRDWSFCQAGSLGRLFWQFRGAILTIRVLNPHEAFP
jgi:hypothetical protein